MSALPHPWYGCCDAMGPNGECSECAKARFPNKAAWEAWMQSDGLVAVRYRIGPADPLRFHDAVYIEERLQRDGTARWVVVRFGNVLNRDGQWEYEPIPSSRTEDFIVRTRWATVAEARAAARAALIEEAR